MDDSQSRLTETQRQRRNRYLARPGMRRMAGASDRAITLLSVFIIPITERSL